MSQPKRKFNLRFKSNTMDEKAAADVWQALKSAIEQIFAANASSLSFEELYRNAYNLVLHKHGQMLYDGVKDTITENLFTVSKAVVETVDSSLLHVLQSHWERQKVILRMIDDILMYMDRTFVQQQQLLSMYDAGLLIFKDKVLWHSSVRGRVQALLLANVDAERRGEMIDIDLMRSTLSMLVDLGINTTSVYESEFERGFIRSTRQFYQEEALEFLTRSTCPDYLAKADRRIKEEKLRVRHYLHRTSSKKLKTVVENLLVEQNAEALVNMEGSGAISMFKTDRFDDLAVMYQLFSLVTPTLDILRNAMKNLVTNEGKSLVTDQERAKAPVEFVQGLLDMRDKYTVIVDRSFGGDKKFHRALREAFEHFMNLDARCAQFLSLYVDEMMRHGFKGFSDEDIDGVLDKVVTIFRYLRDKDVFENFYKHHLQKRLLGHRSLSDDAERNMITKLKSECGFQFTSKLEGMFNDLGISRDFMDMFRKAEAGTVHRVQLEATVLTTGFWPAQAIPPCALPPPALAACERFRSFYMSKHSGRRLTWQTNQGTADIRTLYTEKRHELTVSTYQMCILLQYNAKSLFTFKELVDLTAIPLDELKRHLLSLTTPRSRVLLKLKKGKEIADGDMFQLNDAFTSKMVRIKVPLVSMRSAVVPSAATAVPETVAEDRRHAIEAAVVRIMKTRKTLDHSNLVAEVARQLSARFRPSPADIKKRIESLIERDYLERSEEDRRLYNYLA